MRRGAGVAILIAAVFLLSGCQYLVGLNGLTGLPGSSFGAIGSFDPGASSDPGPSPDPRVTVDPEESFGPDESIPPPAAIYSSGAASVAIGGTVTKLDRLTESGALYVDYGAEASWTDGNGMYLQFYSDPSDASSSAGFVQLDRISDGQHLATADPDACVVRVKAADTKGLSGTATCTGLHWIDTMAGFNGMAPSAPPVGAAFDATITFEAAP